jgi:hypothetical protein
MDFLVLTSIVSIPLNLLLLVSILIVIKKHNTVVRDYKKLNRLYENAVSELESLEWISYPGEKIE